LQLNEIGLCTVSVNAPVVFDPYQISKGTGSFIIIDRLSNVTVGAGMISEVGDQADFSRVSSEERGARFAQKAVAIGLNGPDCENIAYQLERKLFNTGHAVTILEIQSEDVKRYTEIITNAGLICLCPNDNNKNCELQLDTENNSIEQLFSILKTKKYIF